MTDVVMPFPDEIIRLICEFAAEQDQSTAYALALTSRDICQWTAKARWKTITITSAEQLISFWSIIYALPEEIVEGFRRWYDIQKEGWGKGIKGLKGVSGQTVVSFYPLQETVETMKESKERKINGISFPPGGQPHQYVKNLFVDLVKEGSIADKFPELFQTTCSTFFSMLLGSVWPEGLALDPLCVLQRWNGESSSVLETVSLGPLEFIHLARKCGPNLPIKELTIALHVDIENFNFPLSLQRLHVIGSSIDSPLSGLEPPWHLFKSLCTSYMIAENEANLSSSNISKRKLTHIRYDTRRFSFKPVEIIAHRMLHVLLELTLSPSASNPKIQPSAQDATSSFQFDGPRHAAPSRGAGNLARMQSRNDLVPIHKLAQQGDTVAQYMFDIGIGQLAFFQFAWEPMTGSKEMLNSIQPWYKKNASSTGNSQNDEIDSKEAGKDHGMRDETGGWPRERRGAWTERSEMTIDSFGLELREAIERVWGWHGYGIEAAEKYCRELEERRNEATGTPYERNSAFSPAVKPLTRETMERNSSNYEIQRAEMQKMVALIKENVPNCELSHPKFASNDESPLCFGIRAPDSLFHLGGKASLTFYDRLRLFKDRANGGKGPWP